MQQFEDVFMLQLVYMYPTSEYLATLLYCSFSTWQLCEQSQHYFPGVPDSPYPVIQLSHSKT